MSGVLEKAKETANSAVESVKETTAGASKEANKARRHERICQ